MKTTTLRHSSHFMDDDTYSRLPGCFPLAGLSRVMVKSLKSSSFTTTKPATFDEASLIAHEIEWVKEV